MNRPSEDIVFKPRPSRAPPPGSVGVRGWLHTHLFFSWYGTLLTIASLGFIYLVLTTLFQWGIADAVWHAENRRECLDENADGACWAGVITWVNAFVYGRYPKLEQWRIDLAFVLLVLWVVPIWMPRVKSKARIGITAALLYPFLGAYLFAGGERGWIMQATVLAAISVFTMNWLHVLLCVFTHRSTKEWLARAAGLEKKADRVQSYPMLGLLVVTLTVVSVLFSEWTVTPVKTNLWGGLVLTLMIALTGITVALPGGVALALGRRSGMPFLRALVIAYIELLRSVPLITVLFMVVTMVPLFLPEGTELNKLALAMGAVCAFSAAYMAEVVRGGLQSIPLGQFEAAQSIGLGYTNSMRLVILPQALKAMIPNIASSFIGLLKDTTVVSLIGLYDFLLMLRVPGQHPTWIGLHKEALLFGGLVYFCLCFAISKYSQHLEKKER